MAFGWCHSRNNADGGAEPVGARDIPCTRDNSRRVSYIPTGSAIRWWLHASTVNREIDSERDHYDDDGHDDNDERDDDGECMMVNKCGDA